MHPALIKSESLQSTSLATSMKYYDYNNNISRPVVSTEPITRNFVLGSEIGERGRWGRVLAARDRVTGENKVVRRIRLGKNMDCDMMNKEVKQLLIPRHTNIVKYQGATLTDKQLCLIMARCTCPLAKVIPLSASQLLFTCKEVVAGLAYLHMKGVVHGAVRAGNVMLDKEGRARLGDWGLHVVVERDRILQWEAPDVRRSGLVTKQSDIWSLGVLVVECARGSLPYQSYKLVMFSPLTLLGQDQVTTDCHSLVGDCLVPEPGDRPDIETVTRHKYLVGIKVDRAVGRQMVAMGGRNEQKLDSPVMDRLDCGKCGAWTGYSPVFRSDGGSAVFLCDDCVEVEGGHQDCEERNCQTCRQMGRVFRSRWGRQDNVDKLVSKRSDVTGDTVKEDDDKSVARVGRPVAWGGGDV